MSLDVTANPWVFGDATLGSEDSSHDVFPGQKIWIKRLVIFGGSAEGNLMLLDTDGALRAIAGGSGSHGVDPSNQMDPRIVAEGSVAADSRTEVLMGHYVRGLFLDDIPAGGKVEVYHGRDTE